MNKSPDNDPYPTREEYVKQFLAELESPDLEDYLNHPEQDWISRDKMKDFIGGLSKISKEVE